jgi:diphosphomevalonate decarboxylase
MPSRQATARAQANIAVVKYWSVRDPELTLPMNGSISMSLDNCTTETTVSFAPDLPRDELYITPYEGAEQQVEGRALERVAAQLERVRGLAGLGERALVRSRNSFPADAGIASSAAAFAALRPPRVWSSRSASSRA